MRVGVKNLSWLVEYEEEEEKEARLYMDEHNWRTGFVPDCTSLKVIKSLAIFRFSRLR